MDKTWGATGDAIEMIVDITRVAMHHATEKATKDMTWIVQKNGTEGITWDAANNSTVDELIVLLPRA